MVTPSKRQIVQAVNDALGELAKRRGATEDITADTDPIGNIGLASEDGVEFDCIVEELLGIELPGDVNLFIDDKKRKSRTVGQIVEYLCEVTGLAQEVQRG